MVYLFMGYFFVSGLLVRWVQHGRLVAATTAPPSLQRWVRFLNRVAVPLSIVLVLRSEMLSTLWTPWIHIVWLLLAALLFIVQTLTFSVERQPYLYRLHQEGNPPSVITVNMRTPTIWFFTSWAWAVMHPWSPVCLVSHLLQAIHVG